MLKTFRSLLALLLLCSKSICAQVPSDTISIRLDSAERLFLSHNFALLAQQYNIDAQKALEVQARLYANPNFSFAYSLYNSKTKKFLPTGSGEAGGEFTAQLSQLVYLAGKRNKQIRIAEANTKLAGFQFYDLLRTLRYTLRTDFYNIYFLQQSSRLYSDEINSLQLVVTAFNEQEGKGYISQKEVVRVKAQLYSLQSEFNELQNQLDDVESELRTILQVQHTYIIPLADTNAISSFNPNAYPLAALLDSAYHNRSDLQIARANTDISRLNYNFQKSLAVPDLTFALGYDQQGSYINNLTTIGAGIDIPLFNRNQGNIKSAKTMIDVNATAQKSTEAIVAENVYRSLQKAFTNDKLYRGIDPQFMRDFERLQHEVLINYQKRNIGLIDFLDFYEAYKQNILQANSIQFNRVSAFEELNFYTGTNFFN